ncbi:MAG: D-aminoacyl-tRNA deacylase [bacterium]
MRAVVQRVSSANVEVNATVVAEIGTGFLVLLGVTRTDGITEAKRLAAKVAALRVFEDESGRMSLGLNAVGGEILCVSQFTLYADLRRGNRPSFDQAAPGDVASPIYDAFCDALEANGIVCRRGVFGAEMRVSLVNDGPVTLVLDTVELEAPRRP